MQGRYGEDQLSRLTLAVILTLLVLNFLVRSPLFEILAAGLLVWVFYRMLSRNFERRAAENRSYLRIKDQVLEAFRKLKGSLGAGGVGGPLSGDQQDFRIYRCPKCGQKIRIPGGHGKVEITCPRCRTRFRKRT